MKLKENESVRNDEKVRSNLTYDSFHLHHIIIVDLLDARIPFFYVRQSSKPDSFLKFLIDDSTINKTF